MSKKTFQFKSDAAKPVVIAGPCTAESQEILTEVAQAMVKLSQELDFTYVFKASFDKANRTSIDSYRGHGLDKTLGWFADLNTKFGMPILTDIHECHQVAPVAEVCEVLQIPAFLCRQTDLVAEAVKSGRAVNVKKGQFLAPEGTSHIVEKAKEVCDREGKTLNLALTERGASFGYGNLVVDMRALSIMASTDVPVIFDITHSTQLPGAGKTTAGARRFSPLLARAATATGYLNGFFLEVHPEPKNAKSDAESQLTIAQAEGLLRQIIPQWREARDFSRLDKEFS